MIVDQDGRANNRNITMSTQQELREQVIRKLQGKRNDQGVLRVELTREQVEFVRWTLGAGEPKVEATVSTMQRAELPPDAAAMLEQVAVRNSSEVADDLTVPLAIELAKSQYQLRAYLNLLEKLADDNSTGVAIQSFSGISRGYRLIFRQRLRESYPRLQDALDAVLVEVSPNDAFLWKEEPTKLSEKPPTEPATTLNTISGIASRLERAVNTLNNADLLPRPYDLYYARTRSYGPGWDYSVVGLGIDDLKGALNLLKGTGDLIRTLSESFPQFEDCNQITLEAIRTLGKEHQDMIMRWAPPQERIEFTDSVGAVHAVVFESGEPEVGIKDGWVLEQDRVVVPLGQPQAQLQEALDAYRRVVKGFSKAEQVGWQWQMRGHSGASGWTPCDPPDDVELQKYSGRFRPVFAGPVAIKKPLSVEELAQVIYELSPVEVPGEYVDGFQVSPGGKMSWRAAMAYDAEFAGLPGLGMVTAGYFADARALDDRFVVCPK